MSDSIGMVLGGLIVVLPVFLFIWLYVKDRRARESDC
ncbi:MAG: F0F1-type ATP synthase assembly protein I [Rhodothermales bacterium]|jgi:F0F1-type ATP synthase assembly protein I